jgi:hypothetical protein
MPRSPPPPDDIDSRPDQPTTIGAGNVLKRKRQRRHQPARAGRSERSLSRARETCKYDELAPLGAQQLTPAIDDVPVTRRRRSGTKAKLHRCRLFTKAEFEAGLANDQTIDGKYPVANRHYKKRIDFGFADFRISRQL